MKIEIVDTVSSTSIVERPQVFNPGVNEEMNFVLNRKRMQTKTVREISTPEQELRNLDILSVANEKEVVRQITPKSSKSKTYPMYERHSESAEMNTFLNYYGKLPLLSKEELTHDIVLYQEFGDLEARNRIVEHNMLLVVSITKQFTFRRSFSQMDLVQEGCLGLIKAIKNFDYTRDVQFSTYAVWWIKQAMTRALYSTGSEIRIPEWLKLIRNKATKIAKKLKGKNGGSGKVDVELIAEKMNLKPEKLIKYLGDSDLFTDSLDQPMFNNFSDGREINLGNLIANHHYRPDHIALAKEKMEECFEEIHDMILTIAETITKVYSKNPQLIERNIHIVALRFGIYDGSFEACLPQEIGRIISERYGVTTSRQVVELALSKTWKNLPSQYLDKDPKWLVSQLRRLNFLIELTETDRTDLVHKLRRGNRLF